MGSGVKSYLAKEVENSLAVFHAKEAKAGVVFCNEHGIHVKFNHGKEVLLECRSWGYGVVCGPHSIIERFDFWQDSNHWALCRAARQMWYRERAKVRRAEAREAARARNHRHRPSQMSLALGLGYLNDGA